MLEGNSFVCHSKTFADNVSEGAPGGHAGRPEALVNAMVLSQHVVACATRSLMGMKRDCGASTTMLTDLEIVFRSLLK